MCTQQVELVLYISSSPAMVPEWEVHPQHSHAHRHYHFYTGVGGKKICGEKFLDAMDNQQLQLKVQLFLKGNFIQPLIEVSFC